MSKRILLFNNPQCQSSTGKRSGKMRTLCSRDITQYAWVESFNMNEKKKKIRLVGKDLDGSWKQKACIYVGYEQGKEIGKGYLTGNKRYTMSPFVSGHVNHCKKSLEHKFGITEDVLCECDESCREDKDANVYIWKGGVGRRSNDMILFRQSLPGCIETELAHVHYDAACRSYAGYFYGDSKIILGCSSGNLETSMKSVERSLGIVDSSMETKCRMSFQSTKNFLERFLDSVMPSRKQMECGSCLSDIRKVRRKIDRKRFEIDTAMNQLFDEIKHLENLGKRLAKLIKRERGTP